MTDLKLFVGKKDASDKKNFIIGVIYLLIFMRYSWLAVIIQGTWLSLMETYAALN